MQMHLANRGAIAGLLGAIIGIPSTLFTVGGGALFLLLANIYFIGICVFFGMILTPVIGDIQKRSGRINVFFRIFIGVLIGIFIAFILVKLVNGVVFPITITGILEEADL
jgi:hypothetical protein